MNPRHGKSYAFTERSYPGFGLLTQPLLYVHVRAAAAPDWSLKITALVDTGATITLIKEDYISQIPGLDASTLGADVQWSSATGRATCRGAQLDLLLGPATDPRSFLLSQRSVYFTRESLPAPILLGQRGVLDHLQLIHSNCGPKRGFRFVYPQ